MVEVRTNVKIVNWYDAELQAQGLLAADQVRSLETNDALVDTTELKVLMPKHVVAQLGLTNERPTAASVVQRKCWPIRLTIRQRECLAEVIEVPDGPIRIGRLPLLDLDLVVDSNTRQLTGNPEHGDEWIMDLFSPMSFSDESC